MHKPDSILSAAADLLSAPRTPLLSQRELGAFVRSFIQRRQTFLGIAAEHGSPLYVIDEAALIERARQFVKAFAKEVPTLGVYYALKSNNCRAIASILVRAGLGLDVSSGLELSLALDCGAEDIVFSGPGKTDPELLLAVRNRDRVTVLMDSFSELDRLERIAAVAGVDVRAGVRLTTDESGLWRKFGIPLAELPRFIAMTETCRHVLFRGLQFHTSWNLAPGNQVAFCRRLGEALRGLSVQDRSRIEFVDIGGGFWPPRGEWLQPAGTPEGRLIEATRAASLPGLRHHKCRAEPITEFASQIGAAARAHLFPYVDCRVCVEPGRWLCNDAMHILLTVVDKKSADMVITDAGTNAIGWERFETDYFPVINLSRPSPVEHECYVLGSLCTPHDVWGYAYHGEDIEPGDLLLVPTQGAYTYSLKQEFIKPLPKVVVLSA